MFILISFYLDQQIDKGAKNTGTESLFKKGMNWLPIIIMGVSTVLLVVGLLALLLLKQKQKKRIDTDKDHNQAQSSETAVSTIEAIWKSI